MINPQGHFPFIELIDNKRELDSKKGKTYECYVNDYAMISSKSKEQSHTKDGEAQSLTKWGKVVSKSNDWFRYQSGYLVSMHDLCSIEHIVHMNNDSK